MANTMLVKCKACGNEVSNTAVSCPKCGHSPALAEGKTCRDCCHNYWHSCDNPYDRKACPGYEKSPR